MSVIRNTLFFIWEVSKIVLLALLIVIPIRYFVFQPFFVKGQSMEPNFHNNDYLIIDELSYKFREPERGEVIVFKYPNNPSQRYIKRIIGLPGETIEIKDGGIKIFDDSQYWTLDESIYLPEDLIVKGSLKINLDDNEYFVLGDNRTATWRGTVPQKNIVGRVLIRALPFAAFAKIEPPTY